MGVTGARNQVSAAAPELVARCRAITDLPIGVGPRRAHRRAGRRDRRVRRRGDRRLGVRQRRRAGRARTRSRELAAELAARHPARSAGARGQPGVTHYLRRRFPSPPQGVWYVGPIALRAYAIFIIIGIVVAVWWGNKRFVARGGRPGRVTDISVFAVPFGIIGGRIYHVITDNQLYFGEGRNPWNAFAIWNGGLGIWGAIAFGAVGAWIGCRYYKVPLSAYADSVAPGIAVAQAIGRLGNYFNQELFGAATTDAVGPGGLRPDPGRRRRRGPGERRLRVPDRLRQGHARGALRGVPADLPVRDPVEPGWSPASSCWPTGGSSWAAAGRSRSTSPATPWAGPGSRCCGSTRPTTSSGSGSTCSPRCIVFLGAVLFLILRRHVGREDPALVWGPDRPGKSTVAAPDAEPADADAPDSADAGGTGTAPIRTRPADADAPATRGDLSSGGPDGAPPVRPAG